MNRALLVFCICLLLAGPAAAADDAKVLVRQFYADVLNQNRFAAAEKYIAPDAVEHDTLMGEGLNVLENVREHLSQFHTGFPDLKYEIQDVVLDGDRIAVRYRLTGTHRGRFLGIEATGRPIDIEGAEFWRLAKGKIVEHWNYLDSMILMQQLDLIPSF